MQVKAKIHVLSLDDKQAWRDFYQRIPMDRRDLYFTPEYFDLSIINANAMKQNVECVVVECDDRVALYPYIKQEIPRDYAPDGGPYYDIEGAFGYGGIITSDYSQDFRQEFYYLFDNYCRKSGIIAEFSVNHPLINNQEFSRDHRQIEMDRWVVVTDSCDKGVSPAIEYRKDIRANIRKAINSGVVIVESNNESDYICFAREYQYYMQSKGTKSKYHFTDNYFLAIKDMIPSKIYYARFENKIIGAILVIYSDKYASIHLSWRDPKYKKLGANHLIRHEVITGFSSTQSCQAILHGGGMTSSDEDLLYKFKKGFSQKTSRFCLIKHVHNQKIFDAVIKSYTEKNDTLNENYFLKYRSHD